MSDEGSDGHGGRIGGRPERRVKRAVKGWRSFGTTMSMHANGRRGARETWLSRYSRDNVYLTTTAGSQSYYRRWNAPASAQLGDASIA